MGGGRSSRGDEKGKAWRGRLRSCSFRTLCINASVARPCLNGNTEEKGFRTHAIEIETGHSPGSLLALTLFLSLSTHLSVYLSVHLTLSILPRQCIVGVLNSLLGIAGLPLPASWVPCLPLSPSVSDVSGVLGGVIVCPDLQNGQNNGPYPNYTLYFWILGHYFGLFWRSR